MTKAGASTVTAWGPDGRIPRFAVRRPEGLKGQATFSEDEEDDLPDDESPPDDEEEEDVSDLDELEELDELPFEEDPLDEAAVLPEPEPRLSVR